MSTSRPPINLLSVVANQERHKLASGEPWILLLDLVWNGNANAWVSTTTYAPGATVLYGNQNWTALAANTNVVPAAGATWQLLPPVHLRLARNTDNITFDANDGNGPQEYEAFNFEIGELNLSSNGSVPELEASVSNILRSVQSLIEQYAGVVGADLYLYALNTTNMLGEPDLTLQFQVKQTTCDAKLVHFKLGASSPLRRLFPLYMYWPNFCIWQYRGLQCGYSGTMTSCSKTIDGPIGCQAHNNTLRFGGFPGIDTNGASAAGVV